MSNENQITPPPVQWAQRSAKLFVTFCLEDCKDPEIKVEPEQIYFKGIGGTEQKEHEVTINLFGSIEPQKTITNRNGRLIELVLLKKEEGPYWQRLTKEDKKFHWLKCDFNKWKDEDESETEDGSSPHLQDIMRDMGYLNPMGDSKPNFDMLDDMEEDSDDEDLPDLFHADENE